MGLFSRKTPTDRINQLFAAGQTREALALCRQTCEASSPTPQDWLLYGRLSAETGDLTTAKAALSKATILDPARFEAHYMMGKILAATGEYSAALDHHLKATQLQPDNPEAHLSLGIAYGLTQQIDKAEAACQRALELRPEFAAAHFNLANALQAQGRLTEAEAEYEAALQIEPDMVAGWSMLAQARVSLNKFDEARMAAAQALKLEPNSGEAHFTLGRAALAMDDWKVARDHLLEATNLLPNLPVAHFRLGQALYSLKDTAGAIRSFQAALNLNPTLAQAHFNMGQCFSDMGLPEGAVNCYREAIRIKPDHLQAHYSIALVYANMGRHKEAAAHMAEVLRINPADDQARHLLAAYQGQTTTTAPTVYVSTLFDGFADTFDEKLVDELVYRTPNHLFDLTKPHVALTPNSLDVIDLGCGTGLCAPLFRDVARTLHGVDLSPKMIEKARERGLYDSLEINDISSSLRSGKAVWDLAISSDVFVYVGDLHEVFSACAAALKPGGLFAFSVEAGDDTDTFILRNSGRYAHAHNYIQELAARTGFSEITRRTAVIRKDHGQDINGYLYVLQHMPA